MTNDDTPLITIKGNRSISVPIDRCPRCGTRDIRVLKGGKIICSPQEHVITPEDRRDAERRLLESLDQRSDQL